MPPATAGSQQKTEGIRARLTPEQRRAVEVIANVEDKTLSEVVLHRTLDEIMEDFRRIRSATEEAS